MHLGDPAVGMLPAIAIVPGRQRVVTGIGPGLQAARRPIRSRCASSARAPPTRAPSTRASTSRRSSELPIVFVCENNLYGASTRYDRSPEWRTWPSAPARTACPQRSSTGWTSWRCARRRRAVAAARRGGRAARARVQDLPVHGPQPQRRARATGAREEEEEWAGPRPAAGARRPPGATPTASALEAEVKAELDDAVEFARSSPFPTPEEAWRTSMPDACSTGATCPRRPPVPPADDRRGAARGHRRGDAARSAVFLIGEDIGVEGGFGGAFGVYLGLVEEFGHERIIDTPISEKAIAGAAVGAAVMGMRPIADMQYSDFLFECMDELVNQAAKLRYMSGGKLSVPMVMRAPVGATTAGRTARPVPGELLHPRARAESGRAVGRLQRQGNPEERGPRRQPGAGLRAQAALRQQGPRGGRRARPHRRGAARTSTWCRSARR